MLFRSHQNQVGNRSRVRDHTLTCHLCLGGWWWVVCIGSPISGTLKAILLLRFPPLPPFFPRSGITYLFVPNTLPLSPVPVVYAPHKLFVPVFATPIAGVSTAVSSILRMCCVVVSHILSHSLGRACWRAGGASLPLSLVLRWRLRWRLPPANTPPAAAWSLLVVAPVPCFFPHQLSCLSWAKIHRYATMRSIRAPASILSGDIVTGARMPIFL